MTETQIQETVVQPVENRPVEAQVQQPQGNYVKVIPKDPGIAAVLSFLFTGLGQIYNGEISKGLFFIVIQFINLALMLVVIGFITFPLFWIYGIWDAHKVAKATHGL